MRALIYDVAISLDGFIAGPGGDASRFLAEGPHVTAYHARLQTYSTVVMGRSTYEFGYAFGLKPGDRAYPHMEHWIASSRLELPTSSAVAVIRNDVPARVRALKSEAKDGGIYLCGGGHLAGQLAGAGLIDRLVLKVNPILLGDGVRLFGETSSLPAATLTRCVAYDSGVVELEYALAHPDLNDNGIG